MFTSPTHVVPQIGIREGMKVADFGSGSGAYVVELAHQVGYDGKVYAVDIQKELLDGVVREAERAGYRNIVPVWADLEKIESTKLQSGSLDVVLISNLLFQIKNKGALLKEAARITKQNGKVVVVDWEDSYGGMGPQKDAVVYKEDALAFAEEAHLGLLEEFSPGEHHYGLILTKQVTQ